MLRLIAFWQFHDAWCCPRNRVHRRKKPTRMF